MTLTKSGKHVNLKEIENVSKVYDNLVSHGIILTQEMIDSSERCSSRKCPLANALNTTTKNVTGQDIKWTVSGWSASIVSNSINRLFVVFHPDINEIITKYDREQKNMLPCIFEIKKFKNISDNFNEMCDDRIGFYMRRIIEIYPGENAYMLRLKK